MQIGKTAKRIIDLPVSIQIDGVDGEVAPVGICHPIITETDTRMPAIGFQINPRLGDFDGLAVSNDGYGSV